MLSFNEGQCMGKIIRKNFIYLLTLSSHFSCSLLSLDSRWLIMDVVTHDFVGFLIVKF